jgi:hypothetical protein
MVSWPRRVLRNVTVHWQQRGDLGFEPDQVHQVQHLRDRPGDEAAELQGTDLATAENRETVAMDPLSKYWEGSRWVGSAPPSSALIRLATYLAPP